MSSVEASQEPVVSQDAKWRSDVYNRGPAGRRNHPSAPARC